MGDARNDPNLFLVDPDMRGIIPLGDFHVPKRLLRKVKQDPFRVTIDQAFTRVMELCAESAKGRESTWINSPILNLYSSLHREGHAHSIECWDGDNLVGGLYGVALGGAFFGESMFSRATDASKIALVHLVAHLLEDGFVLLDAQFHNPHLEQFGLIEIPRQDFKKLLKDALTVEAKFYSNSASSSDGRGASFTGSGAAQRITQIS
ncbi:Leucyl/phenylalanyl-tRNA--protein transferase [hydrothermal vent metagenome]|jgi:leucyl/phenylalanyl-tRNA--protein transferase|uniref:Leucyl/phenylalanyl-tRNA--protein transferase n=2 Tax=root TaxID=1 RepID=A0A160U0R3_9ZZZZ|tara:strand:+ start:498 stop:1115 length:618 start_codon:yes stop_codon:yes gene_type:complete